MSNLESILSEMKEQAGLEEAYLLKGEYAKFAPLLDKLSRAVVLAKESIKGICNLPLESKDSQDAMRLIDELMDRSRGFRDTMNSLDLFERKHIRKQREQRKK